MAITFDPVTQQYIQNGRPLAPPGTLGGSLVTQLTQETTGLYPERPPVGGTYLTGAGDWYTQLISQNISPGIATQSHAGTVPVTSLAPGATVPVTNAPAAALPGGIAAIMGTLGLGALVAPAGAAYGLAQLLGLQMPWETGAGEGFIAPWSRPQLRDESGMWVTAATRPDLFQNGNGAAAGMAAGALGGVMVRKIWTNASRDGRIPATVESIMLTNGTIITRSLVTGEIKKHRPKKHIVISSDPRLSSIKKLDRVQKKVTKLVNKYSTKRRSTQAPSAYLSAVERKLLKAKS